MSDKISTGMSPNRVQPDTSTGRTLIEMDSPASTVDLDHMQALERQRRRREREPLLYCKLVTKYPVRAFLMALGGHILMVVISAGLVASGYDLLPVDFENLPLEINDQPWRPRDLAWHYRDEFDAYYSRTPSANFRENNYARADIFLFYDGMGSNVFTQERLQKIESIENELTAVAKYQSTYCQLESVVSCEKPLSIIRFFDGSYSSINAVFNDSNYNNINAVLYEASTNNLTAGLFRFFLGKDNEITASKAYSGITRSMVQLGYPLNGYDTEEEYEAHIRDWQVVDMKPILVRTRTDCKEMDFSYLSQMLWLEDVFNQAMKDVLCAVGSICFIFILILVHTRSLWVSGFAILSIVTSFVGANLVYRVVLGFKYIGFFHILTLFIILGIGADDIFVFYDVWRNTAYENYPSLAHRLSDAYRKSVFSMLFTSITTAVAFFASAISPLLATRSFGVFSGLVIIVNYTSVILYFPTVVNLYHQKFEQFKWSCFIFCEKNCTCCSKSEKKEIEEGDGNKPSHLTDTDVSAIGNGDVKGKSVINLQKENEVFVTRITVEKTKVTDNGYTKPALNGTDNGFAIGHVNKAFEANGDVPYVNSASSKHDARPEPMKRKQKSFMVRFFRNRYSWFVTHPVFRWLKVLKDSHVYSIADTHSVESFVLSDSDRTLIIYIAWGMLPNDMEDCHFSTPECDGKRRWDPDFNPSTPAAQTAMKAEQGTNWDLTYDYNKTAYFMKAHTSFYDSTKFNSSYAHYLEIPISYWLNNKNYTNEYGEDFYLFDHLIGEEKAEFTQPILTNSTFKYGNNIRYVGIQVNTTLRYQTLGYSEGIPVMDLWEEFVTSEMASMPTEMKNGFQVTRYIWHWLIVSQMLAQNAIYGIAIGVSLAFPILVLATGNVVTGFLATLSMCCSTVCVIGVIPLGGWKLGVLVSLNMCMVVGLTVDYVVHLAEGYSLSLHKDRRMRVRDMLDEMAVSVFFGAITTLGASLFMFLAQLSFFLQFGIFMFSTIGFSLFFSMGLFVTLMGLVGPEGDTGNLLALFRRVRAWCRSRKGRKEEDQKQEISASHFRPKTGKTIRADVPDKKKKMMKKKKNKKKKEEKEKKKNI
ncbi:DISP1-like protein [Mya arenaria]|uniref:DISP1-like protein n=1 Tax=Mya arenaria TaxID=6604 RepID=A0ABY7FAN3_MYAAR|nr:DISP1-like protein [Mya arenaria]